MSGPYRHNLEVKMMPVAELQPWAKNPRDNDAAAERLAYAIGTHGWTVPILLDRKGQIVAGHTRFKAALKLNLEEVPTITLDAEGDEAAAIAIADNRLSEIATWDNAALAEILQNLDADIDLAALGFDEGELEWIMEGGLDLDGMFEDPELDDYDSVDPGGDAEETDIRVVQLAFSGEEHARYQELAKALKARDERPMPNIVLDALADRLACDD